MSISRHLILIVLHKRQILQLMGSCICLLFLYIIQSRLRQEMNFKNERETRLPFVSFSIFWISKSFLQSVQNIFSWKMCVDLPKKVLKKRKEWSFTPSFRRATRRHAKLLIRHKRTKTVQYRLSFFPCYDKPREITPIVLPATLAFIRTARALVTGSKGLLLRRLDLIYLAINWLTE